jgi:quercetin dioxygenase-like cupin family protein
MKHEVSSKPVTGNVGTKVLYENEKVKIWEMSLAPGEETDAHEHKNDYILVIIDGDKIAGIPHVQSKGDSAHYIEADVAPGSYFPLKKGGIEVARNIGKKRYHEILIELKY